MNIFKYKSKNISNASFIIAMFTFIGGFLSIFRNTLLASTFGATKILDIYYASFRIPDFIFNIIILGTLSAGFIPLFTKYEKNKESEVFASSIIVFITFLSSILALVFIIFANNIVNFLFPGYDVQSLKIIASLTRIMMIQPIILGISSLLGNMLNIKNYFVPHAVAPLFYNLGIIIGITVFYPIFGVYGLAYGVILGAVTNLLIKFIPFKLLEFKFVLPAKNKIKTYIKEFSTLTVFRAFSIINIQLFLFVLSYFASFLEPGSLGIITFVISIQDWPKTIIATSIAIASFPYLSRNFLKSKEDFSNTVLSSLSKISYLSILVFSLFFVLQSQIIKILLNYGLFKGDAIQTTIIVFSIVVLGFIFYALHDLLLKILFAANNTILPFIASLVAYILGGVFMYFTINSLGIVSIAWGYVLANLLYAILLGIFVNKFIHSYVFKVFFKKLFIFIFIGILSSIAGKVVLDLINIHLLFTIILVSLVILATYIALSRAFKLREINIFQEVFNKVLKRK